jgi:hypothetical protein
MTEGQAEDHIWDIGYALWFFVATFASIMPPATAQTCDNVICGVVTYDTGDTTNPLYNFPTVDLPWPCNDPAIVCDATTTPPTPTPIDTSAADANLKAIAAELSADQAYLGTLIGKCAP